MVSFQTLQLLSPVIDREECKAALDPDNMAKSRFRNILPGIVLNPYKPRPPTFQASTGFQALIFKFAVFMLLKKGYFRL